MSAPRSHVREIRDMRAALRRLHRMVAQRDAIYDQLEAGGLAPAVVDQLFHQTGMLNYAIEQLIQAMQDAYDAGSAG
jgi:hypothetical protein